MYIEVWFTDQHCKPLEMEDKTNLTLVINYCITCKMRYSTETRDQIFVKGYGYFSFAKSVSKNLSVNAVQNFEIRAKNQ